MLDCKKHPKYMAIMQPTADCPECKAMFEEAQRKKNVAKRDGGAGSSSPSSYDGGIPLTTIMSMVDS